jgi:hypothetical protein
MDAHDNLDIPYFIVEADSGVDCRCPRILKRMNDLPPEDTGKDNAVALP